MTKNWIVGIDGSTDARSALEWAVSMASARAERVTPVSAWHLPVTLRALAVRRGVDVDRLGMQAEAATLAHDAIEAVAAPDVVDEPVITEGHPAPVLLERAGDNTVIVVGQRGIGRLQHRLLGSVSQYLATHATGPVVVVPDGWSTGGARRIVVGFDGSDHAKRALRWTLDVAPPDTHVTALVAIDIIPWLRPELVEERHPEAVAEAKERIGAAADEVDPARRAHRSIELHGPRQAFSEIIGDADLIVVGPRGVGGAERAILGSVTTWLLHSTPCPIAVVPSP